MQITTPNMPETLTYAVLASVGIDVVLAILLAVRGDWLGTVLVLAIAAGAYWFLGRHAVTIVPATVAAAACTILLLLATLTDLFGGHPYYGILFLIATAGLGFIFVLLRQGTQPAELKVGGVVAVDTSGTATLLAMLAQLRDAGVLTAEEYAAKSATLKA
jgi:hypothetical protein